MTPVERAGELLEAATRAYNRAASPLERKSLLPVVLAARRALHDAQREASR